MNRTLKCIAKNKINPYRTTQLLLSLPFTGWKLQDKNSNNKSEEQELIKLVGNLDIGGHRVISASSPILLNGKGSKQRVKWSKKFEKNYKDIFKKKDKKFGNKVHRSTTG